MKIKEVRHFRLRSEPPVPKGFWEERLVRPVDIYDRFRAEGPPRPGEEEVFDQAFLEVAADNGQKGIFGPVSANVVATVEHDLRPLILGEDPFVVEKIWDIMYRYQVHGRKGVSVMAMSVVDCALWDLIGKAKNEPVVRLLGGPVQDKVPAYASMLGFSLEPKDVVRRCQEYVDYGFKAMKWFFRHGPGSELSGIEKNVELVKTIRDRSIELEERLMFCS